MPLISITRLRLRGYRFLLPFMWHAGKSAAQAQRSPGYRAGALSSDVKRLTFWTTTVWENEAAMQAFRASGDHRHVMPKLADWCDEGSVAHWEQADAAVPTPNEVLRRMQSNGHPVRVHHPSPDHAAGRVAADGRAPKHLAPLPPRGA